MLDLGTLLRRDGNGGAGAGRDPLLGPVVQGDEGARIRSAWAQVHLWNDRGGRVPRRRAGGSLVLGTHALSEDPDPEAIGPLIAGGTIAGLGPRCPLVDPRLEGHLDAALVVVLVGHPHAERHAGGSGREHGSGDLHVDVLDDDRLLHGEVLPGDEAAAVDAQRGRQVGRRGLAGEARPLPACVVRGGEVREDLGILPG